MWKNPTLLLLAILVKFYQHAKIYLEVHLNMDKSFFAESDLPQRNNRSKTHKGFTEYKYMFFFISDFQTRKF